MKASSSQRRIEKALAARYPLVYVQCHEEARLEGLLSQASADHFGDARPLTVWTRTRGFTVGRKVTAPICDPLDALRHIRDSVAGGFYLMADLPAMFAECPSLIRGLRDLYDDLAGRDTFVFLSSARLEIPEALQHQMFVLEMGAPSESEIVAALEGFAAEHGLSGRMGADWMTQAAGAMKGLMLNAVRHLMLRLVAEDRLDLAASLTEIREEKAAALMREACLKYIGQTVDIEQVGGLDNLKEWVRSRTDFFYWSGAEIEQAIRAAVVHAWQEQRPFTERDVLWSTTHTVPLSRTMEEQIKQLRLWSQERATPASRKPTA